MELSEKDIVRLDKLHEYVWDNQPEFGIDPIETMWKAIDWYFEYVKSFYDKKNESVNEINAQST